MGSSLSSADKSLIRKVIERFAQFSFRRGQDLTGVSYWERRVKVYGRRAVLNLNHLHDEYDAITDLQEKEIFPHLRKRLQPSDRIVLDLGCGPGRFTCQLASMCGGRAIGIDPVAKLIAMAPKAPNVEYRVMREGDIPLSSNSIDVVWSCLVLGGIADITLSNTIAGICRVLKKGGLLFLVENTSPLPSGTHWIFRQYKEYKDLFPFVNLEHLHDYFDLGERISVMAGRKS
jgi:ubiquinone/menaquinone biosynthesis C-methylase UbiE